MSTGEVPYGHVTIIRCSGNETGMAFYYTRHTYQRAMVDMFNPVHFSMLVVGHKTVYTLVSHLEKKKTTLTNKV